MYSKDSTQIRQGLVNYIGALLSASHFEPRAAKHDVAAMLVEETLGLSQEEVNAPYDLYVLKPLLRGTVATLEQRMNELAKLPRTQQVAGAIRDYGVTAQNLKDLIQKIK